MLSLVELERAAAAAEARFAGARLERVIQPQRDRVVLVLYGGAVREKGQLLLCANPETARLSTLDRAPKAPPSPPAFAQYLRAHAVGGRLARLATRGGDRQVELVFETPEGRCVLLLSLFGRRSNLYALDADDRVVASLRPLSETRSELAFGEPWTDPASGVPQRGR
ncbi:MAG: NFACT family protein, partial [Proteobacteria bacterium]|nr:NFACT family protein [Pseudomonadota bacterium]